MRKTFKAVIVLTSIVCLILSLFLSSCTKHPNEDQLQLLEEKQKEANSAEDLLAKKQQEKADLERELAEKKQKLEDAKSEKEAVKNRIGGM
jgi:septal ring factor EnvC (AmiA/AmiB activator)